MRRPSRFACLPLLLTALALAGAAARAAGPVNRDGCPGFQGKNRFLFVSDSHGLGPLGEKVDGWLRTFPASRVDNQMIGGSSTYSFVKVDGESHEFESPHAYVDSTCTGRAPRPRKFHIHARSLPFGNMLADIDHGTFERKVALIQLGTNVVFTPSMLELFRKGAVEMVKAALAEDHVCVWIGPPRIAARIRSEAKLQKVYDLIGGAIAEATAAVNATRPPDHQAAPCRLIDSRKYVPVYPEPPGSDGYHFMRGAQIAAGEKWGDGVISELRGILQEPGFPVPADAVQCVIDAGAAGSGAGGAPLCPH